MNQAIQFSDNERWDKERRCVVISAIANGFQIQCAIGVAMIAPDISDSASPEEFLARFRQKRWDIEDELEQRILQDDVDPQGWIYLS